MTDWVKLRSLQLGEWLPASLHQERGEWVTAAVGRVGALLRLGATDAEAAGTRGLSPWLPRRQTRLLHPSCSEPARMHDGKRATADTEAMPRHESASIRNTKRREGRNSPKGEGALPEWKAAKVEGLRRQIADHQASINRSASCPRTAVPGGT